MSKLFSQTLREDPSDTEVASHKLLIRAGFTRQLAAGIFSLLPLGARCLSKIGLILREEMNAMGGQEIRMPVVHPAEIWKETGRWNQIDAELSRFKDRADRDMVLAMTHEEVVADLVRKEIRSYRQLPRLVYQIHTKWRDDPRPRAGLIRLREFTMKDSYSLDADGDGLEAQYRAHYQAYFNIFHRCGLPVMAVKSDVGMMGGQLAHEFMYLSPMGEDSLVLCDQCGYAANRQLAQFTKRRVQAEALKAMGKVATPDTKTIEDLTRYLGVPDTKTAKSLFLMATVSERDRDVDVFTVAVVRGDMDVNEAKLANAVKAKALRPAREEEILSAGAVPGYGSPVGLQGAMVVVDDAIPDTPNMVAGANEPGYHLINVNYGRDFEASLVCDLAEAKAGDACPKCGHALRMSRGVEVGNIFKLGTRYSEAMGCTFLEKDGQAKPVVMGSYGIGLERLMACIAEEHHDDDGLIWPITVAPYHVHLVGLFGNNEELRNTAVQLYEDLQSQGLEVLFDDRGESAGVKLKDADLIGLPLRLTVSERSLEQGGVEMKRRDSQDRLIVALEEVPAQVRAATQALEQEITRSVVAIPYRG
ncbi:MAG: proline--tRNA ligase [Candidatus Fraserbacteria bacterium RBG_16_55_9]|uniref:Proline--tRNA ligase n=1 Tax=Fraserbacteria sp. (strain RBG_16_55_9) TaxID=1817864 RepID=A0A1F5UUA6_FRAXR|nr:MAG: proline--tRNA ligase [Candidatus Fraserbacteria bacterium RBG_16_55_9]